MNTWKVCSFLVLFLGGVSCSQVLSPNPERTRAAARALAEKIRIECSEIGGIEPIEIGYRFEGMETAPVLDAVELWVSRDGGATWRFWSADRDGISPLEFRATEGRYGLRLLPRIARQEASAPAAGDAPMASISVDTSPPTVRIVEARRHEKDGARIHLDLEISDPGETASGVDHLSVWTSAADGSDIRFVGQFPPLAGLGFDTHLDDRLLGVFVVAYDRAGNHGSVPDVGDKPQTRVPLGVPDVAVQIASFQDRQVLAGGSRHYIFLRLVPEDSTQRPERISIHYAEPGNADEASWQAIAEDLPFTDRYIWEVPRLNVEGVRLRLSYWDQRGRRGEQILPRALAIDSTVPSARIVRAEDLGQERVRLHWRLEAERGSTDTVKLWFYRKTHADWVLLGTVEPGDESTSVLDMPPGRHGLKVVAEDRVGHRLPVPEPADAADIWIEVGETDAGRLLSLKNFHGGLHRGASRRYVFWDYRGEIGSLEPTPFSLSFSLDGGVTWDNLARNITLESRKYEWNMPAWEGVWVLLRIEARVKSGRVLSARSNAPFFVESRPPSIVLEGPTASRSPRTPIRFSAWTPRKRAGTRLENVPLASSGEAPAVLDSSLRGRVLLDRVECYALRSAAEKWTLVGTWRPASGEAVFEAQDSLEVFLENGSYRIAVVAWDQIGNHSPLESSTREGPGRLLVDTVKPYLKVDFEDSRDLYLAGEDLRVGIASRDAHLASYPIRISLREERESPGSAVSETRAGSKDVTDRNEALEHTLEEFFPPKGDYLFRVPLNSGGYVFRVRATDLAGNHTLFEKRFRVMPRQPGIRFLSLARPTSILGGEKFELRWQTRFIEPGVLRVRVEFSEDGGRSYKTLAEDLPNDGTWAWQVPEGDLRGGLLKIAVRNASGQEAYAISEPFTISTKVPRVTAVAVEGVSHRSDAKSAPVDKSD